MSRTFVIFMLLTAILSMSLAVDIGPVSLHKTRCLSNRFKGCEECYIGSRLAMCYRLALGKFHSLVAWEAGRTEDLESSKAIIEESCDFLMDKDTDMQSITCIGFKSLFVNEDSGLEAGASPEANTEGARQICVKFFVSQKFGCAMAVAIVEKDEDGKALATVITIILSPACSAPISVFNGAYASLMASANFSEVYVNDPQLDYNSTGNSTLRVPFLSASGSMSP